MGSFYTNVTVCHATKDDVAATLESMNRTAYVSPQDRSAVVVFDAATETQDTEALRALTQELSVRHHTTALGILNHDDDVLLYLLYRDGARLDEYNSLPGYFGTDVEADFTGGNASILCSACEATDRVAEVARILGDTVTFEVDRHAALVDALGLPQASVGMGYEYISRGEFPPSLTSADLRAVGATPTRTSTRPADAAIQHVLDRLDAMVRPSPELAALIGPGPHRYQDAAAAVMTHIITHGLLDRSTMIVTLDDALRRVFGTDRIPMAQVPSAIDRRLTPI